MRAMLNTCITVRVIGKPPTDMSASGVPSKGGSQIERVSDASRATSMRTIMTA